MSQLKDASLNPVARALLHTDVGGVPTPVSNTNPLPSTVTGGLTDAQLRATAVPVDTEMPTAAALADGAANPTAPLNGAANQVYNGATWDRQRGNTEGTLLASAARTATTVSAVQTNHNARGVFVGVDVTAVGTGTLTLQLRAIDIVSGLNYNVASMTSLTTSGRYGLLVYPGVAVAALGGTTSVQAISAAIPRTWVVVVTHSDGSSWTYSLSYSLIV